MKNKKLEKFLNWFENSPTYKTIWFIPFVLILWLIAAVKKYFKEKK